MTETSSQGSREPREPPLDGLTAESAVRVTGQVNANPIVSLGGLEIIPERVTVGNRAAAPLPIDDNVLVPRPEPADALANARHIDNYR